ncbi:lyase family protein [Halotalea alkalilenta]|uniref:lyase family protein n=1 Tax=Halotalea alkalilenta TaxID=376489 RepID=UPI000693DEAA|nr:lyase family protein [Halotalea alkalilenta]
MTSHVHLLSRPLMSAAALEHFSAEALVGAMLRFELELAGAEELAGELPEGSQAALARHLEGHRFDILRLEEEIQRGGNVAIPFVRQAKEALPEPLRKVFHLAATSQDVLDSALMQLTQARLPLLLALIARVERALAQLIESETDTLMIGRTLMQQALPISFGVKAAQWALGLDQAAGRLAAIEQKRLPVQFGGPVGMLEGLENGPAVMDALAARLGLHAPALPWHTDRQPVHALATGIDAVAGALEKFALDISLLTQSEIGEVREPGGKGVGESSSMPHKRNPVRCALIIAAARQIHGLSRVVTDACAQPLERGLGQWHAEWAPLIELQALLEGALEHAATLAEGLELDREAMRTNLAAAGHADAGSSDNARLLCQRALKALHRSPQC